MKKSRIELPQPAQFSMGNLFKENFFKVPMYQRNYAWGSQQIDEFVSDLSDLVDDSKGSHFFGQLVTFKGHDERQEIIDGQQRLTTSLIFFTVLKDIAQFIIEKAFSGADIVKISNSDSFLELHSLIKEIKDIIGVDNDTALIIQSGKINGVDLEEYFLSLTTDVSKAELYYKEHQRVKPIENMHSAYVKMKAAVIAKLNKYKNWNDRINKLQTIFESFTNGFYLVMISTLNSKEAFTIFETLNSRGLDLAASDIIKNHLMSIISSGNDATELAEVNESWNNISVKLDNDSKSLTKFIRTYWSASNKVVSEAKLYRAISQKVSKKRSS